MKKLIGGMIASVALAIGCGAEDPPNVRANPDVQRPVHTELGQAPEGVPAGYVQTPVGYFHESCVHEVPDGAEVDTDGAIWMSGQMMRAPAACAFKSFRAARGQAVRPTEPERAITREQASAADEEEVARKSSALGIDGWVSYVEAPANNLGVFPPRFNGLESTMTVPPTPTVQLYQLIYLFVSLTPADGKAILQPVLQWGGAAGAKWMAAGWFVDRAGNAFNSTRVNVTVGETIKGTIRDVRNSCVGTNCQWDVKILRGNSTISSLRVRTTEAWSVAQKAVLEAYNLTACRQLPTGKAFFLNTKVYAPYDSSNVDARIDVTASLNWRKTINTVSPSCGFDALFPHPPTAVLVWNAN